MLYFAKIRRTTMSVPQHIAIIPDGNRRWAKKKNLPAFFGHRAGAKTTEKILTAAIKLGIPCLTFWGASINNVTKRDSREIGFLFKLFTAYFKKITKAKLIHQNEVKIQVLGLWPKYFPKDCQEAIKGAMTATKNYKKHQLTILLAYNGTEEMVAAMKKIAHLPAAEITDETIKQNLYTKDLPQVDLVIRTGGEPHLSAGFMMWDIADAQLYFSPHLWPDFSETEFTKALKNFEETERRLGK